MGVEFEQGAFGRFYVKIPNPSDEGTYVMFTYLLEETSYIAQSICKNGLGPERLGGRVFVEETPAHRRVIANLRRSMELLGKIEMTKDLPNDGEPLIIYSTRPVDKLT